jgi:hypothetical protein
MPIVKGTSRIALGSAVGSATTAMARGEYTTLWNYREGYVATTDPDIAGMIAVGAVCVGVAAFIWAARPTTPPQGYGYASGPWG